MASTDLGYTPVFHMPIIAPPTEGDNTTYYDGLDITISSTNQGNNGIKFEISGNEKMQFVQLYSMTGGVVKYIPGGANLPDGTVSPGQGSVVLKTNIPDTQDLIKNLPSGIAPVGQSIYLKVKSASFRTALEAYLTNLSLQPPQVLNAVLPEKILNKYWAANETPDPTTINRATKQSRYLDGVMTGENTLFVDGGTGIGEMELNGSSNPEFTLKFIDGTGIIPFSPLLHLRNIPTIAGQKWENHPLITATSTFSTPVDIYVKFEVWNPQSLTSNVPEYVPVDQNLVVELRDYDPLSFSDDLIDSKFTNVNGAAQFSYVSPPWQLDTPDLYFKIINPICSIVSEFSLPSEWSTKGSGTKNWKAVDGSPGYYEGFQGNRLGSATEPLIFKIGVDFHLKFQYQNQRTPRTDFNISKGTLIKMYIPSFGLLPPKNPQEAYLFPPTEKFSGRLLDNSGIIHGIVFDLDAGDDIFWGINWNMESDPSINMISASTININPLDFSFNTWYTSFKDSIIDQTFYFNQLEDSTIGSKNDPKTFIIRNAERNAVADLFNNWRQLHVFLNAMTDGDWDWENQTSFTFTFIPSINDLPRPFSIPVGNVNYTNDRFHERDTEIHEISHQLVWINNDIDTFDLGFQAIYQNINLFHQENLIATEFHAYVEGWAEFLELIFVGGRFFNDPNFLLVDEDNNEFHFGLTPDINNLTDTLNRGLIVEGAFAYALRDIFWNLVVAEYIVDTLTLKIFENPFGDITDFTKIPQNAWLLNINVRNRFLSLIWNPIKQLVYDSDDSLNTAKTSTAVDAIIQANPLIAHKIRGIFQAYNMGYVFLTMTTVLPSSGSKDGVEITITGTKFIDKHRPPGTSVVSEIEVVIGGIVAPKETLLIISENELRVTTHSVDASLVGQTVDVEINHYIRNVLVSTSALQNAFTYTN